MKAQGRSLRLPRPAFEVTFCDLKPPQFGPIDLEGEVLWKAAGVPLDLFVQPLDRRAVKGRKVGVEDDLLAEDGVFDAAGGDVVHLAVEQVGLFDGPDVHLGGDPFGARPGDAFLLEPAGDLQAIGIMTNDFRPDWWGSRRFTQAGSPKRKSRCSILVEGRLQLVVGVLLLASPAGTG